MERLCCAGTYIREIEEFIRCLVEFREPSVTEIDRRIAVIIGHAAWRSYEKARPVSMRDIEEEQGSYQH